MTGKQRREVKGEREKIVKAEHTGGDQPEKKKNDACSSSATPGRSKK